MSEHKWTDGPWRYVPQDGRKNQQVFALEEIVTDYSPTKKLATVIITAWKQDHSSAIPNAHLIAAAPDLYEALLAMCLSIAARPDIQSLMGFQENAEYNAARLALAKARGETP